MRKTDEISRCDNVPVLHCRESRDATYNGKEKSKIFVYYLKLKYTNRGIKKRQLFGKQRWDGSVNKLNLFLLNKNTNSP